MSTPRAPQREASLHPLNTGCAAAAHGHLAEIILIEATWNVR
jgi:hypothetical protein